jgi:hypothetical protein
MLYVAPGLHIGDKNPAYWDALHLRDKIAPENTPKRNLKWNPFTGEEILVAFCSPENREKFPNLFAQQKSLFPALYNKLEDISLSLIEEGTADDTSAASAAPQQQQLQLGQLTGEELYDFFSRSNNRQQFPNLFAQQKSSFPHDYDEDGELEKAITLSLQDEQAPEVEPSGENVDDCSIM